VTRSSSAVYGPPCDAGDEIGGAVRVQWHDVTRAPAQRASWHGYGPRGPGWKWPSPAAGTSRRVRASSNRVSMASVLARRVVATGRRGPSNLDAQERGAHRPPGQNSRGRFDCRSGSCGRAHRGAPPDPT
jgi:hypothetical protein